MIVPCEIASKAVVPTVRAIVAKQLSESYKMKQGDIASLLGVTQSAVSQYLGNIRGKTLDLEGVEEVEVIVKDIAYTLMTNPAPRTLCKRCCEACRIIRERKMLCPLHKHLDPLFKVEDCDICVSATSCF